MQRLWQPEVPRGQQQDFYAGLYGAAVRFAPTWELTGRILAAFKRSVERRGARLIVVYVPSIVQVEEDNWRAKRELYGLIGEFDLRKPNAKLAGFAEQHGLVLIDLLDEFRKRPKPKPCIGAIATGTRPATPWRPSGSARICGGPKPWSGARIWVRWGCSGQRSPFSSGQPRR